LSGCTIGSFLREAQLHEWRWWWMRAYKGLLVSPQSRGVLYTHCFLCWACLTGPVSISVPRRVFCFENGPNIETLSSASEFLGDILNIWDNDRVLVYCTWRRTMDNVQKHNICITVPSSQIFRPRRRRVRPEGGCYKTRKSMRPINVSEFWNQKGLRRGWNAVQMGIIEMYAKYWLQYITTWNTDKQDKFSVFA
jgi:hypothetical protein